MYSQDQFIYTTAPTTLVAQITNASGWTVDSMTITVDDTNTIPATVQSSGDGMFQGTVPWNDTSGNPSEHTVYAQANIHINRYGQTQSMTLDSRTTTTGAGRAADFMVADISLKSLAFTGNIALADDGATPIATPEFTWDPASGVRTTSNPVAYVQGKSVSFTMALCTSKGYDLSGMSINGGATMGYVLKLVANPNTTNPSTGQPDSLLTLYDNTTASPVAPTPFTDTTTTVTATTPLSGWVSAYGMGFDTLDIYVKFAYMTPTPVWRLVSSYVPPNAEFGSWLYAVVAAPSPTGLMAKPWLGVLTYACDWAGRTSDATSATTALAKGLYNSGTYNSGNQQDTSTTTPETFYLGDFLSGYPVLYGQCNDFADFLFCASTAIGAKSLQVQRIDNSFAGRFTTTSITASHDQTPSDAAPEYWYYHQFAGSDTFFDGCLRLQGTTTPADLALQTYTSSLIAPGFSTSAASLFTPTIKNTRSNP